MAGIDEASITARAIVAHEPVDNKPNWKIDNLTLRALKPNELLVRIVATGICHTDIVFAAWPKEAIPYPKVLGHEGSGYVEKIGSKVEKARVGDPVLLSFQSCSTCKDCKDNHPSYCQQFAAINYGGEEGVFQITGGAKTSGTFFGQSSLASYTIVKEDSVVNVSGLTTSDDELRLFAPLGCGFQTGMGTVDQLAAAGEKDTVVIIGLGGVGLAAIMLKKCATIIGIDRFPERLDMARNFGATHVINTSSSKVDLVEEVKALTNGNGSSVTIDTTGNMSLIENGMNITANRGQMIFVGVPPVDALLSVHVVTFMQTGKLLRGSIEGDVTPSEYIPKMIQRYREGQFPIDKLVKFYQVEDFEMAMSDMESGKTVKPVLTGMGNVIEMFHRTTEFDAILGGFEDIIWDMAVRQALKNFPQPML